MTTAQENIRETARRDGEALSEAMQDWVDSVQKFVGTAPSLDARVVSANHVVDSYFHVLEQILIVQRDFVKSCLTATYSSAKTAAPQKH